MELFKSIKDFKSFLNEICFLYVFSEKDSEKDYSSAIFDAFLKNCKNVDRV